MSTTAIDYRATSVARTTAQRVAEGVVAAYIHAMSSSSPSPPTRNPQINAPAFMKRPPPRWAAASLAPASRAGKTGRPALVRSLFAGTLHGGELFFQRDDLRGRVRLPRGRPARASLFLNETDACPCRALTTLERMLRAIRTVFTLAAICGAAGALMSAPAMAARTGTLSGAEFKQLSTAMAGLSTSANSKTVNWGKARAACRRISGATALLRDQRASCLDSISALEALASFPSEQAKCATAATSTTGTTTTGTTTTGTTMTTTTTGSKTTPASSALIRMIICLSPQYHALAHYAKRLYRADIAARKQALVRGFTGTCLATLASTPADLKKEKPFAASTASLAHDVTVLIKVTRGRAPTTDLNQVQIDSDIAKFERSARAVLDESGPQKLSACRHR